MLWPRKIILSGLEFGEGKMMQRYYKHFYYQSTITNIELFVISVITKKQFIFMHFVNRILLNSVPCDWFHFHEAKLHIFNYILKLSLRPNKWKCYWWQRIGSFGVTYFSWMDTYDGFKNKTQCTRMHYFSPSVGDIGFILQCFGWAKLPRARIEIISWTLILSDIIVTF